MRKHRHPSRAERKQRIASTVSIMILGLLTVTGSFAVGIQTAGDVTTVPGLEASSPLVAGDLNGNGRIDTLDALIILEVVQGYREPSAQELRADPNGDGELTIEDATSVLEDVSCF